MSVENNDVSVVQFRQRRLFGVDARGETDFGRCRRPGGVKEVDGNRGGGTDRHRHDEAAAVENFDTGHIGEVRGRADDHRRAVHHAIGVEKLQIGFETTAVERVAIDRGEPAIGKWLRHDFAGEGVADGQNLRCADPRAGGVELLAVDPGVEKAVGRVLRRVEDGEAAVAQTDDGGSGRQQPDVGSRDVAYVDGAADLRRVLIQKLGEAVAALREGDDVSASGKRSDVSELGGVGDAAGDGDIACDRDQHQTLPTRTRGRSLGSSPDGADNRRFITMFPTHFPQLRSDP